MGYIKAPVSVFAQRKFIELTYNFATTSPVAGNSFTGSVVRVNDLFSPIVASNNQPYGYDQWANFYNRYRVHACKVHVVASIRTPDANGILFMGTNAQSSAAPTLNEAYTDPNYRFWVFSNAKPITRKKYYTIAGIEGKSKTAIRATTGFGANFGQPPSNIARVIVGFTNAQPAVANIDIDYRIMVKFYAELNEPKALPASVQ